MASKVHVKVGETLSRACSWSIDGDGVDLTGYTVECAGIDASGAPVSLSVTLGDQTSAPGSFTISAGASTTAQWRTGEVSVDVAFRSGGGDVRKSATFILAVEGSYTL